MAVKLIIVVNPWSHAAELLNKNARQTLPPKKNNIHTHTHTKEEITESVARKFSHTKEKRNKKYIYLLSRSYVLQTKTKSANFHLIFPASSARQRRELLFRGFSLVFSSVFLVFFLFAVLKSMARRTLWKEELVSGVCCRSHQCKTNS